MQSGPSKATLQPFDARPMFERVRASLLELLADLPVSEWHRPTPAGSWLVRDVVAHLLGDDVGRLSRSRDNHLGPGPDTNESLSQFVNRYNEQWVRACARLSPQLLTDFLAHTSKEVLSYWQQVDLDALGEPVSWACPDQPAPVWLDCARDFTEDWIHQQQIRQGLARERTWDWAVLYAVIDTFMHAMSYTLDQEDLTDGDSLVVRLQPDLNNSWAWLRTNGRWSATRELSYSTTELISDADTWWRLCVGMLSPSEARRRIEVNGDERLARAALNIISIIG
jgi:uncharacterized protein (TIGR03083 family)